MATALQVLIVATDQAAIERVLRALRKGGYEPHSRRVGAAKALEDALRSHQWNLVLYIEPLSKLGGIKALQIVRTARGRDIPFIFVADKANAETAVALVKAGAHDYVAKRQLARLASTVKSALQPDAERRQAKPATNKLAREHELFAQILANSPDAIYVKDRQRRYVYMNNAMRSALNVPADADLIGKTTDEILSPDHAQQLRNEDEAIIATGAPLIDRLEKLVRPDGNVYWLSTSKVPLWNGDGAISGIIGVTRDVTRRMRIDEARSALQNRLNHVLELAPDAIIATDADQCITLFNKSAERIFGYHADEVLGQPLDVLLPPKTVEAHRKRVDVFMRGSEELKSMESRGAIAGRHKSGREFPAEATISKYVEGDDIQLISIVRDITVRHQAEEELRKRDRAIAELNARLLSDNAKLTALNSELEAFSYSVSHDLRAPLRAIDGFSRMLHEECDYDVLDDRARDHLARIRRAAQRMGALIDDLLTLSRISRVEVTRRDVDLSEQTREILATLQTAAPERTAEFDVANGIKAYGDAGLLRIVLDNLLANAWKFTGSRSPARIEFGTREVDGGSAYFVRDNGVGFDMKYAGKLFSAFQRLHDERKFPGDGIGLAIVKRIVNKHGGRIWAEGEQDKGATFYFTL